MTTPGKNKSGALRKSDKKSEGDYVTLWNEDPRQEEEIYMFHPFIPLLISMSVILKHGQYSKIFSLKENVCTNYQL